MAEGPHLWDIGDPIVVEIFIADPLTGFGLTGQTSYTEVTIQRDSDANWWTGSEWSTTRTALTPAEADSTNEPGRYTYTLPSAAGNVQADRYVVHVKVDNPPTVQGSSYEVHVSREQDVRVYESEPV